MSCGQQFLGVRVFWFSWVCGFVFLGFLLLVCGLGFVSDLCLDGLCGGIIRKRWILCTF